MDSFEGVCVGGCACVGVCACVCVCVCVCVCAFGHLKSDLITSLQIFSIRGLCAQCLCL